MGAYLGWAAALLSAQQQELLYIERQGPRAQVGLRERREATQPGERPLGVRGPRQEATRRRYEHGQREGARPEH